jgi:hypothetical protein
MALLPGAGGGVVTQMVDGFVRVLQEMQAMYIQVLTWVSPKLARDSEKPQTTNCC